VADLLEFLLNIFVLLGDLTNAEPEKRRKAWRALGITLLVVGIAIIVILLIVSSGQ
jgi:hypothetical protein